MTRRVLIVVSSNQRRGAQLQAHALTAELCAAGIEATLVALAPGPPGDPGLGVDELGRSWRTPTALRRLRRLARRHDLVVAFGSTTLPAAALALAGTGTPFVYRSIGEPRDWVRGRLHRWRTARLMHRAVAVFALWPGAAASIHELYGVPPQRIVCLPNARSADEFRPVDAAMRVDARRRLGVPDDGPVVAWIGSFAPEKRVGLALDALARLDDVHVLVAGGALADLPTPLPSAVADRVTFTGVVTDTAGVYAAADVVLSTSATEGMPGVLIEAGLSGVAVVATAVGSVPWLFEQGLVGTAVPAATDAATLADAVARTLATSGAATVAPTRSGRVADAVSGLASVCTWPFVTPRWIAAIDAVLQTDGDRADDESSPPATP